MPLKMKLLSVSINIRNVVITLDGNLDGDIFSFSLTACIPSSFGILVYRALTSMVTSMSFSSTSLLISDNLLIVSVESLVYDLSLQTSGRR